MCCSLGWQKKFNHVSDATHFVWEETVVEWKLKCGSRFLLLCKCSGVTPAWEQARRWGLAWRAPGLAACFAALKCLALFGAILSIWALLHDLLMVCLGLAQGVTSLCNEK